jgi:F-type H+-transporting ATPase subunit c
MALDAEMLKQVMPGLTIAIGGIFPAIAIGWMGARAMEAIGRNPEAANKIQTVLILVVAFAEAIAIYSLVVALIIKFV